MVGHTMKDKRWARRRGGYVTAHGTYGSIVSTPGLNMATASLSSVLSRRATASAPKRNSAGQPAAGGGGKSESSCAYAFGRACAIAAKTSFEAIM